MLSVYKKLIGYVPEKKHYLYLLVFFSLFSALLQILSFYYIYEFLTKLIINSDLAGAETYAFYIASLMLVGAFFYFLSLVVSHLFAFRLETNLRKFGIEGLINSSFRFFDMNSSGKTRKLLDDNAAQTHVAVAHLIPDNVGGMLMPLFVLALGFSISIRTGVTLLSVIVLSLILMKFMLGEKNFMAIYLSSLEKMSGEAVEFIRGMNIIKIFGVDVKSFKTLSNAIREYSKYALNYSLSCRRPYVLFQLLFYAISAILIPIILFSGTAASAPKLLAVELVMVFFLSGLLLNYLMKVMHLSMYLFQAQDAVSKLENLYDEMGKNRLKFGCKEEFEGFDIEFDKVSFGYTDKLVLKDLSFNLQAGKTYALVGSSGSGKSTIAKLISGFYNVTEGAVKIGGLPLTSYSEKSVIKNISFVFQEARLFKTSIFENVKLAKKDATDEEVFEALRLAKCENILSKFDEREKTIIGSKGVFLSGGEKQRIVIARAILKNSKIVIFDEASAAIDPDNEHELQKAFANLMKGKTVIMIAHRLTSIKNVDEILVLDNGKIIERGNNKELMEKKGVYAGLQTLYKEANDWRLSDEKFA